MPLRVTLAITMLELGGAQRLVLCTAEKLDRARFAPSLLAGPGGLLDADARALPGVEFWTCPSLVREVRPMSDARALVQLVRRFRRTRPHIVHTNSSKAGIVGRIAASLAGVPVIVHTVHGWGFAPGQSVARRALFVGLERFAARLTTRCIAVSEANARAGAAHGIAHEGSFTIIRPGITTAPFAAAADNGRLRAELGLAPGTPLVGMVACLKPQKAPLDYVDVAARVVRDIPGAHFVLLGDGVLRPALEAAVAGAGIGDRFHLLGWRRDPETVTGDVDVVVLTSLHEGLPMVVPEAMSAGRPVVATAVDGTPEAVRDGETGFLAAPGDTAALADRVLRLLRDGPLRARFGDRARALAPEWDIDLMVRRHEDLYLSLAQDAGLI